jgi:hypothetical protein
MSSTGCLPLLLGPLTIMIPVEASQHSKHRSSPMPHPWADAAGP